MRASSGHGPLGSRASIASDDAQRVKSAIQFTSQVLPASPEKDCSILKDVGGDARENETARRSGDRRARPDCKIRRGPFPSKPPTIAGVSPPSLAFAQLTFHRRACGS